MNRPYGDTLVDLLVHDAEERKHLRRVAAGARSVALTLRSLCDLELLATGALSPLHTFMGEADYRGVLRGMRLADGRLYPIPVTLPLPDDVTARRGETLALRGRRGEVLAVLTVDGVFGWDRTAEALYVYGTLDQRHPLVAEMASWPSRYVTGPLKVLQLPAHDAFHELRRSPSEVRIALGRLGAGRVVAFNTRNPMHRVHEELTKRAAREVDGVVLIHPVVGQTRPGDVDPHTRILCYRELVSRYYDPSRTLLSLLPLAMRMAGPREALWHAIIRRNYGATHMIVGRDHAGPGRDSKGTPFYGPQESRDMVRRHEAEIGVKAVTFDELVYVPDEDRYLERWRVNGRRFVSISGTQVRDTYLKTGAALPPWFTRPEVAAILARRSDDGLRSPSAQADAQAPMSVAAPSTPAIGERAPDRVGLAGLAPGIVRRPLKGLIRGFGAATSALRPLPEFLIIGAHRAGTTSLYRYLEQHPCMARTFPRFQHIKDVRYFDENYFRGAAWYRSHFPTTAYRALLGRVRGGPVLTGEASPYYLFHPAAPERASRLLPDVRLIVLLRDPVERAYSHWKLQREVSGEPLDSFEEAIAAEPARLKGEVERILNDERYHSFAHEHLSYVTQGFYLEALRAWLDRYPREQVYVESTERLLAAPQEVYDRILRFLGLPPFQLRDRRRWHAVERESPLNDATRAALVTRFAPHNRALEEYLGIEFGWHSAKAA